MNKDFLERHSIVVLDTNKRAVKYKKINLDYFRDPFDFNKINEVLAYDTEPLLTIEIAASELEKIADFESQVFNHMKAKGHYDMFGAMMKQKEKERYFRDNYPAVKKAYEQYSLVLKLAESGEL